MKRSILLLGTVFFAFTGLLSLAHFFVVLPAEAADTAPDMPQATAAPPEIFNIYPTFGYKDETTFVIIDGINFVTDTAVYLDAIQLMTVTASTSTFLDVEVPPGLPFGAYDVRVVNPDATQAVWADAYTVLANAEPTITAVSPNKGPNDLPLTIDIYGQNLHEGSWGNFTPGFYDLGTLYYVDSTHLRAVVPQNIPTGVYTLEVSTPNELYTSQFAKAYEALDPSQDTDLFAGDYGLWRQPLTIRLGDPLPPTIGLNVRRQGGLTDVVPVDFYLNAPSTAAGGTWIGQSTTPPLPPNSTLSTLSLEWTPPGVGNVTLFAVIDPADEIVELDEANNIISRTVKVLPPSPGDITPPVVTGFRINNGAVQTNLRQVVLDTTAVDDNGTDNLHSILFVEFAYVQSAGTWMPVRASDWLPFTEASVSRPTKLIPSPGLHFFKVWVADKAGNISAPAAAFINYKPDDVTIGDGEVHVYRLPLQANDSWQVQTTTSFGITDLYVWNPADELVDIRENGDAIQTIVFTAAETGIYQIEVEGRSNALYQLSIAPSAAGGAVPLAVDGPLAVTGRAQPFVDTGSEPTDDIGLPDPPPANVVYLPAAIKD